MAAMVPGDTPNRADKAIAARTALTNSSADSPMLLNIASNALLARGGAAFSNSWINARAREGASSATLNSSHL
jgi:hypothetical protein